MRDMNKWLGLTVTFVCLVVWVLICSSSDMSLSSETYTFKMLIKHVLAFHDGIIKMTEKTFVQQA